MSAQNLGALFHLYQRSVGLSLLVFKTSVKESFFFILHVLAYPKLNYEFLAILPLLVQKGPKKLANWQPNPLQFPVQRTWHRLYWILQESFSIRGPPWYKGTFIPLNWVRAQWVNSDLCQLSSWHKSWLTWKVDQAWEGCQYLVCVAAAEPTPLLGLIHPPPCFFHHLIPTSCCCSVHASLGDQRIAYGRTF